MFNDKDTAVQKNFFSRMIAASAMISLAYILLLMTPDSYRLTLQEEINSFRTLVGIVDAEEVLQRASNLYSWAFIQTGVIQSLEAMATSQGIAGEDFWLEPMIRIVENLKLMCYQTVYRMSVFLHWLVLAFPLMFALASDGYYQRKRKQYEFGVASANIFRIWVKTGVFAFFIIDVYFIFPAAGAFGVLLPPFMFLVLGFSMRYALSNVSKVF